MPPCCAVGLERNPEKVRGKDYPFFFNPMWAHFGDGEDKPPGTYYYASDEHVMFYWNMFDQVLLRPALVGLIPKEGVEIVTQAGAVALRNLSPFCEHKRLS